MENQLERIRELKKEKNAVIFAHYYVADEVQEAADYIGDSYFLSEKATQVDGDTIVLCGVEFMGESAKILNPAKTVLIPDRHADCPMAHMATVERIEEVREQYEDVAVVCYVNSTAELKMHSDVCVTSSNALNIVKALPNRRIFFIPDEHLGRYVARQVPEKEFIFNDGYCHVHCSIGREDILLAKKAHPDARVLAHPECKGEVTELADYVGSTAGILACAAASDAEEFIIATEMGVFFELKKQNQDKRFYAAGSRQICPNMKKITLSKIIEALESGEPQVRLSDEAVKKAYAPLRKMLELAHQEVRR